MTIVFKVTDILPIGKSRYFVMMEPIISKPPDEPPTRREIPIPIPTKVPPNTADNKGSGDTGLIGIMEINDDVAITLIKL